MKTRKNFIKVVSLTAMMSALFLNGCGNAPAGQESTEGTALVETGTLTLSVNPEIQIEYDGEGNVMAVSGQNDDGEKIVSGFGESEGRACEEVLQELVTEINEAGYFQQQVDGQSKNIVLQLEPGSVLPSEDFLEKLSASTQEAVKGLQLGSGIVTIDGDDYDEAYAKDGRPSPYISLEKAQEIALAQANVNAADAVFEDKEFDHDDGTPVFELEFTANGNEYEYDIDARTGKVLEAEHTSTGAGTAGTQTGNDDTDYGPNSDGVTDYNDTDYGPNSDGVTDYNDTDYGPNNDGVTDYNDTDYGPNNDGVTDYSSGNSGYDDGNSGYDSGNSGYGNSSYDDGNSGYGNSGYDD